MFSATYDPKKPPTMTTGVLMVPEETIKAMQAEIERLRDELAVAHDEERRWENLYLHKAENAKLRAALLKFACSCPGSCEREGRPDDQDDACFARLALLSS